MGTITSKDTRRISFDNTFALSPALVVQNAIEDDNILSIDPLSIEKQDDLLFPENKIAETHDDEIDYWARRIDYLKKEHRVINKIIENEYEKTIENTNKLLEVPKLTPEKVQKIQPCYELRSRIIRCYEENPHQPLTCSPLVQAFRQCVTSCRIDE